METAIREVIQEATKGVSSSLPETKVKNSPPPPPAWVALKKSKMPPTPTDAGLPKKTKPEEYSVEEVKVVSLKLKEDVSFYLDLIDTTNSIELVKNDLYKLLDELQPLALYLGEIEQYEELLKLVLAKFYKVQKPAKFNKDLLDEQPVKFWQELNVKSVEERKKEIGSLVEEIDFFDLDLKNLNSLIDNLESVVDLSNGSPDSKLYKQNILAELGILDVKMYEQIIESLLLNRELQQSEPDFEDPVVRKLFSDLYGYLNTIEDFYTSKIKSQYGTKFKSLVLKKVKVNPDSIPEDIVNSKAVTQPELVLKQVSPKPIVGSTIDSDGSTFFNTGDLSLDSKEPRSAVESVGDFSTFFNTDDLSLPSSNKSEPVSNDMDQKRETQKQKIETRIEKLEIQIQKLEDYKAVLIEKNFGTEKIDGNIKELNGLLLEQRIAKAKLETPPLLDGMNVVKKPSEFSVANRAVREHLKSQKNNPTESTFGKVRRSLNENNLARNINQSSLALAFNNILGGARDNAKKAKK
jgi:hypothetical protein